MFVESVVVQLLGHYQFQINLVYNLEMIGYLLLVALLCSQTVLTQNPPYTKVVHNLDANAKCLDGSPAALYLSQGDPRNIIIYFMGGASCSAYDTCYQRSKAFLGSSLYWPQTSRFNGILSNDPIKNIFANWTKAVFLYCDGAFHQGNSNTPIKYKDAELYFRGSVITKSHLKFLNTKYNFQLTNKVIVTGSSAGGIATYIWSDYIKTLFVSPSTRFYSVPESSIFLNPNQFSSINLQKQKIQTNSKNQVDPTQILLSLSNKDSNVPNQDCFKQYGKENQYLCISIQTAFSFLKTEALFLQSSYDQYLIRFLANLTCLEAGVSGFSLQRCNSAQMQFIEDYRSFYLGFIQKLLNKGHNIWTISCSWHSVIHIDQFYSSALEKVPVRNGKTMQQVVYEFVVLNQKVITIDIDPWPLNSACAY